MRITLATAALTVPTVLLALAYSSLTAESRIAAFAWFATWVACWITHGALTGADLAARSRPPTAAAALDDPFEDAATPSVRPRDTGPRFGWLETHYLRLYINYLRDKLEQDPHNPRYILTERGVGYRFIDYKKKA